MEDMGMLHHRVTSPAERLARDQAYVQRMQEAMRTIEKRHSFTNVTNVESVHSCPSDGSCSELEGDVRDLEPDDAEEEDVDVAPSSPMTQRKFHDMFMKHFGSVVGKKRNAYDP